MCKEYATRDIVKEIKQSLQGKQYIIQHIMREDKVSWLCKKNVGIDKGKYTFSNFNNMDSKLRRIKNSDKLNCPYLRVSPTRK